MASQFLGDQSHGAAFFIAVTDAKGNSWAQGPLHSGDNLDTACLDIHHTYASHTIYSSLSLSLNRTQWRWWFIDPRSRDGRCCYRRYRRWSAGWCRWNFRFHAVASLSSHIIERHDTRPSESCSPSKCSRNDVHRWTHPYGGRRRAGVHRGTVRDAFILERSKLPPPSRKQWGNCVASRCYFCLCLWE
jgi:hypothetical protein